MKIKRKELYGLLYVVVAFFLAVLIALNYFAFSYSTLVSNFFHQSAFRIEADENAGSENTNYFNLTTPPASSWRPMSGPTPRRSSPRA